jgi:hypothetical protein
MLLEEVNLVDYWVALLVNTIGINIVLIFRLLNLISAKGEKIKHDINIVYIVCRKDNIWQWLTFIYI